MPLAVSPALAGWRHQGWEVSGRWGQGAGELGDAGVQPRSHCRSLACVHAWHLLDLKPSPRGLAGQPSSSRAALGAAQTRPLALVFLVVVPGLACVALTVEPCGLYLSWLWGSAWPSGRMRLAWQHWGKGRLWAQTPGQGCLSRRGWHPCLFILQPQQT